MKTVWNSDDRRNLQSRLAALRPDTAPRWGRMSAPQMVCHLVEALRMATGELSIRTRRTPLRMTPFKQGVIYLAPLPRGAPTAPELLARVPEEWACDVALVQQRLDALAALPPTYAWPPHPLFGRLSWRAWGVLIHRHIDHHLRQFRV